MAWPIVAQNVDDRSKFYCQIWSYWGSQQEITSKNIQKLLLLIYTKFVSGAIDSAVVSTLPAVLILNIKSY